MRCKIIALSCLLILFSGCVKRDTVLNDAIELRDKMLQAESCSFQAIITADYVDRTYCFEMECSFDENNTMSFVVLEPESISGISGTVSDTGGALTFDDVALAFPTLANGRIMPVTAPWIFFNGLCGGYLSGCASIDGGYEVEIDDSYDDDSLRLKIDVINGLPVLVEIYSEGYRVVTIEVENFVYV